MSIATPGIKFMYCLCISVASYTFLGGAKEFRGRQRRTNYGGYCLRYTLLCIS